MPSSNGPYKRNQLDTDPNAEKKGALDVLAQYILNCCCWGPYTQNMILEDCLNTWLTTILTAILLSSYLTLHLHGGYALQAYLAYINYNVIQKRIIVLKIWP